MFDAWLSPFKFRRTFFVNIWNCYTKSRHTQYEQYNTQHHESKFRIESTHTPGRADGNFTKKAVNPPYEETLEHSVVLKLIQLTSRNMRWYQICIFFGNDCTGEWKCLIDQEFSQLTMMDWQNNEMIPCIFKDNHHRINSTECWEY